jgi:LPXTG-motif cell wall-anchored protein
VNLTTDSIQQLMNSDTGLSIDSSVLQAVATGSSSQSTGIIIGVVVPVVIALIAAIILIYFKNKKNKK